MEAKIGCNTALQDAASNNSPGEMVWLFFSTLRALWSLWGDMRMQVDWNNRSDMIKGHQILLLSLSQFAFPLWEDVRAPRLLHKNTSPSRAKAIADSKAIIPRLKSPTSSCSSALPMGKVIALQDLLTSLF